MSDATTRGTWDDVPPKATEVLDPALEEIKWGLEEVLRTRDAEIRELKAVLRELAYAIRPEVVEVYDDEDRSSLWVFAASVKAEIRKMPHFVRWWCQREGVPNPLEGGEK